MTGVVCADDCWIIASNAVTRNKSFFISLKLLYVFPYNLYILDKVTNIYGKRQTFQRENAHRQPSVSGVIPESIGRSCEKQCSQLRKVLLAVGDFMLHRAGFYG
jgi:hypothetical protein